MFKIVGTYWHDHSLEHTWGALSNGTISFLIQLFWGGINFLNFYKKTSTFIELNHPVHTSAFHHWTKQ
jgi:hypothetical protein